MDDKLRAKRLLIVLATWGAIVIGTLFYYTVYARAKYLKKGDEISLRRGIIPALRGQILDRNGVKLAWSEVYYDLVLKRIPSFYLQKSSLFSKLESVIGPFTLLESETGESLVLANLEPKMVKELEPLVEQYHDLAIRLRTVRSYYMESKLKDIIGSVSSVNGEISGVSGLELKYDSELRGKSGSYVVMVDSRQRWIPGKWKLEHKVEPGVDIILKNDISQLIKGDD